jgi:hemerythrin-like domain-containing protein
MLEEGSMRLFACTVGGLMLLASYAGAAGGDPVTKPFRDENVAIKEHLGHMEQMAANVRESDTPERHMRSLVAALKGHIGPHAAWEEEVLYPVVDRQAGEAQFTRSMRYEHRIVERTIGELERMADSGAEPARFAQRAEQLLGLIHAHFEVEEEVLLPVLDSTMSREEFEREVLSRMEEH